MDEQPSLQSASLIFLLESEFGSSVPAPQRLIASGKNSG